MKKIALSSIVMAVLLAGCAATRVEPPAPAAAPPAFKETGLWQKGSAQVVVPGDWWALFQDPVLNDLEQRLVIGNEELKATATRVATARAQLDASRAALFPTLSLGAGATRSDNGNNTASQYSLTATAGWEIDLWGRLAQAGSAAQAGVIASEADLAAARLSAQALLAQTYFSLRAAEAQGQLLERSVAAYRRSLELTQVRYQGGVASRSDVLQAQTQLRSAEAQALETRTQRAQLEHAIAVLLGLPPSALNLSASTALPAAPAVPEFLPATLLERRPDIAAAQARVRAAYAQIGIADAAFFPALTLSANGGYRGASLSDLVSAPNLVWSLGVSLAQSILDGGQRKLASAQARANADLATSNYRQAVLMALQEVEDNLVAADALARQAALQQEALEASQRNLEIVLDQYRAGTVSYLNVVLAQTAALNSESSLLSVRNRQLAAVNQLLKNVAGRLS